MTMNVGTIAYEAHSGLGHLAKSFFDNGIINRILVISHPHYQNYDTWYPSSQRFTHRTSKEFLDGLDILIVFENAFRWNYVSQAKQRKIPIVLIPNYEYTPFPPPVVPDLFICASLLDIDYYKQWKTKFIQIPVDTRKISWRLRERAIVYVHNAGHGGWDWRNGTPQLLGAINYVKSPIRMIVRGQPGEERTARLFSKPIDDPRVEMQYGEFPEEDDLWSMGDVYVAPERYNGMSLPLQEACAAGMLVMTTNRYPMNTWLPNEPMIPVTGVERKKLAVEFDRCIVDPRAIAKTIDEWYGRDITKFSNLGAQWAIEHSWDALKPVYLKTLQDLL